MQQKQYEYCVPSKPFIICFIIIFLIIETFFFQSSPTASLLESFNWNDGGTSYPCNQSSVHVYHHHTSNPLESSQPYPSPNSSLLESLTDAFSTIIGTSTDKVSHENPPQSRKVLPYAVVVYPPNRSPTLFHIIRGLLGFSLHLFNFCFCFVLTLTW